MMRRHGMSWLPGMAARTAMMVLLAATLLAGCSRDKVRAGTAAPEEATDLVFSDAEATCTDQDGLFGGRYVTFRVTATVKNDTDRDLGPESMPVLASSGFSRTEFTCDLDAESLAAGSTGKVSFEGMFDVRHETVPVLAFSCKLTCSGLEAAQTDLNGGLADVVGAYAQLDADEEARRDADERARQAAVQAMRDCVGSPATAGLAAAEEAGYSPIFKDLFGVDVTANVNDPEDQTGARDAAITEVDVSEGVFLDSVSYALDHTDPVAAREREEEAAKAREAKEAREEEATKGGDAAQGDAAGEGEAKGGEQGSARREDEAPVTAQDNEDLARVLAVEDAEDPLVARFANAYEGRQVSLEATVTAVEARANGRFDLDLTATDPDEGDATRGPTFRLAGVRPEEVGLAEGSAIERGAAVEVTARVAGLDEAGTRILLTPIEAKAS